MRVRACVEGKVGETNLLINYIVKRVSPEQEDPRDRETAEESSPSFNTGAASGSQVR